MKKFFITILLCLGIIFLTNNIAYSEIYTYKVYDNKTNQTYNAEIKITPMRVEGKEVFSLLEFYSKNDEPICFISFDDITKNSKGLVQGKCKERNSFIKNPEQCVIMNWTEITKDTFWNEIRDIEEEMSFRDNSTKLLYLQ